MNVDCTPHHSGSRSVAQRLKQCSLKDLSSASSNGNIKLFGSLACKPSPVLTPKQHNIIRIIAQYLRDLGLKESLDVLTEESGCKVENAKARQLREAIYRGNWNNATAVLDKCYTNLKSIQLEAAKLIILEEKFYDLLYAEDVPMALRLLREEYPNVETMKQKRCAMIRMLFMCKEQFCEVPEAMRFRKKRDRRKLVVKVQQLLPATFMLPPARLEQLLNQARIMQVSRCRVHVPKEVSNGLEADDVFVDHSCQRRPTRAYVNTQTITDHKCEVWCVEFSPDGNLLASCSRSTRIFIHTVSSDGSKVELLHLLSGYDNADIVSCISWSGDSKLLAVACTEQVPFDIMIFAAKEGRMLRTISNLPNSLFTTCAFFNAPSYILIAGDERGHLQICDLKHSPDQQVLGGWEGYRIRDVYGMSDCVTVLASDTHHRLRRYRFNNRTDDTLFTEEVPIICFRVHPNERFVLTTTQRNLRMWDIRSKTLVRNFYGAHQGNLVIRGGFGGHYHRYIASGTEGSELAADRCLLDSRSVSWQTVRRQRESRRHLSAARLTDTETNTSKLGSRTDPIEGYKFWDERGGRGKDGKVLIWGISCSRHVLKLRGHKRVVNGVCWNPKYPRMLASCSQDATVRIWNIVSADGVLPTATDHMRDYEKRTCKQPTEQKESLNGK